MSRTRHRRDKSNGEKKQQSFLPNKVPLMVMLRLHLCWQFELTLLGGQGVGPQWAAKKPQTRIRSRAS
jgi:hypothetical protein